VLVMSTERAPEREAAALRTLLAHRVDGVLVATSGGFEPVPPVPIVFFDNLVATAGVANVARANREGMRLLVDHLADVHGHTRLAYIGGPPSLTFGVERAGGFRAALARHGIDRRGDPVRLGDHGLAASLPLHARQTRALGPPTEVRLPEELVVRRSCGCDV